MTPIRKRDIGVTCSLTLGYRAWSMHYKVDVLPHVVLHCWDTISFPHLTMAYLRFILPISEFTICTTVDLHAFNGASSSCGWLPVPSESPASRWQFCW